MSEEEEFSEDRGGIDVVQLADIVDDALFAAKGTQQVLAGLADAGAGCIEAEWLEALRRMHEHEVELIEELKRVVGECVE